MVSIAGASTSVTRSQGEGSIVGWYVGEDDGLPRRLPVHATARDRYLDTFGRRTRSQRMIFIPEAGTYDTEGTVIPIPGTSQEVRQIPLPDKYSQLRELATQENADGTPRFPLLRRGYELLLSGKRSVVVTDQTCACGLRFGSPDAFEMHQRLCSAAAGARAEAAVSPPAPAPTAPAATRKVPNEVNCRQCGETFADKSAWGKHNFATHRDKPISPIKEARDRARS